VTNNSNLGVTSTSRLSLSKLIPNQFLVTKFEFEGSFEGDCHEVVVIPNLELFTTFGISLEGVCHELYTLSHYKLVPNLEVTKNSLKKAPS
jgi:hypothetical protein